MKNDNIVIDSDKIDAIVGRISSSSVSINDGAQKSRRDFSCLQGSKDLSEGVNVISDSMSFFSDKINGYKKIVAEHGAAFFEQEMLLSSSVDSIEIPKELSVVDNIFKVDVNSVHLSKNDGKSVNANDNLSSLEYEDSNDVIKEKLESINNNKSTEEVNYYDTTSIYKNEINNINNNTNTESVEMKDEYDINKENISNINSLNQEEILYNLNDYYNKEELEDEGDVDAIES